jgi:hypothetical protein
VKNELPPCGLYRTVSPIGDVEAGRLVYFHNHGNPGAGLYFPEKWTHNRAHFTPKGMTVPPDFDPRALRALPAEGFYRVETAFFCCAKKCMKFEPAAFVQLGYNGAGRALLFVPELAGGAITVPETGAAIDDAALTNLVAVQIVEKAQRRDDLSLPRGIVVH